MRKLYISIFAALAINVSSNAQVLGILDPTFGTGGSSILSPVSPTNFDNAQDVVVQADGKSVFCGTSGTFMDFDITVVRLREDGDLDASFGTNGVFSYVNTLGSDFAYDIALLNDGKFLVTGATSLSMTNTQFVLMRLTENGILDETFGTGGVFTFDLDAGEDYSRQVLVTNDGYIMVGSSMVPNMMNNRIGLVKCDLNGELDSQFGSEGFMIHTFSNEGDVTPMAAAMTSTGLILISGYSNNTATFTDQFMLAQFTAAGQPNVSYDEDGIWVDGFAGRFYDVEIFGNSFYVCGNTSGASNNFIIRAYGFDGGADSAFGDNGEVLYAFSGGDVFYDMTIEGSGNILACGTTGDFFTRDIYIASFTNNGSPITSWGTNAGYTTTNLGDAFEEAYAIQEAPSAKFVIAGFTSQPNGNDFAVCRYHNNLDLVAVNGCTNGQACNYNVDANIDDASCFFIGDPCDDSNPDTVDDVYNENCECQGGVGITEISNISEIKLFPNPTQDILNIQFSSVQGKYTEVTILDVTGRIVQQEKLLIGTGVNTSRINVSNLSNGLYSLVIENTSIVFEKK
ncbi:MAG: hypothetical protein RL204_1648 [Bacteroidota bacterium]|jgi:uncharacterized delta-60 repeat protein